MLLLLLKGGGTAASNAVVASRPSGGFVGRGRPVKLVYDRKRRKEDEEQLEQAVIEALPAVTDTPESLERRAAIVKSLIRGDKPKLEPKEAVVIDIQAIRREIERQQARLAAEAEWQRQAHIRRKNAEFLLMY